MRHLSRTFAVTVSLVGFAGAALAQVMPSTAAPADTSVRGQVGKIRGDLDYALRVAREEGRVWITIVMRDQVDPQRIAQTVETSRNKAERRARITALLSEHAAKTQESLLAFLDRARIDGRCDDSIQPLWLHSVVGARVSGDLLLELADRDDVAWINVPPDPGTLPDGAPRRPVEPMPAPEPGHGGGDGADAESEGEGGGPRAIECGVALMGAPQVWNELDIIGRGVIVGVIDTGCCWQHPDLVNQVWTNTGEIPNNNIDDDGNGFVDDIHGWSFDGNGSSSNISDSNGHGTHVTGTVAGDGTNGTTTGMAPGCQFMTLKFWNSFSGELSVWNSMQYIVNNGGHVITASLGWPHNRNPDRATWRSLCENAMAAGVVVVYAAGNEGTCCGPVDNVRTPGDVPDVITAGATNCSDVIANFSSRGPVEWANVPPYNDYPYPPGKLKPTISAPGVDTISTRNNCTGYLTLSGTSMATPHVAGAVALILEANPELDHFAVKQILKDTAVDLGTSGPDNTYGHGRVDAYAAVVAALETVKGPATIVDFVITSGSLVSGGLPELAAKDGSTLDADSAFGFTALEPNVLEIVCGFETAHPNPSLLDIVITTRLNNPGGLATTSLLDWSANEFITIDQFAVGTEEITQLVEDIGAAGFVRSADGRIETALRQTALATFSASGFRGMIDHIGVTAR